MIQKNNMIWKGKNYAVKGGVKARVKRRRRIPWFKKLKTGKSKKILYWQKNNRYFSNLIYLRGKKHFLKFRKRLKKQLKKKLTVKNFYRQFYGNIKNRKIFKLVNRLKHRTNKESIFLTYFEQQLPKYLCRLGFVKYLTTAKLLITNNFISINKKNINNLSYIIKKGDVITVDPVLWYNLKLLYWKQIIKKNKKTSAEISYNYGIAVVFKNQSFFNLRKSALVKRKIFKQIINEYR